MTETLAEVREALARGDLFGAYDAAARAIAQGDGSEDLYHQHALTLARMGDTARALDVFRAAGLDRSADPHKRALGARLLKDRGLEGSPGDLAAAYRAYRRIYEESGDPYPGINAASLALLVGEEEQARTLAEALLDARSVREPFDYYCAATRAEALLILGRLEEARAAAALSLTLPGGDVSARAGTMHQLRLVAERTGIGADRAEPLLALLRAPSAFHYAGHIFLADPAAEARILAGVEAALERRGAGFAYGALAAGADILVAETVLRRGGELHIVLPCAWDDFLAQSVRPAGASWTARAHACLAAAKSVTFASHVDYVSDPELFAQGAAVAMGLARLKAQQLSTRVFQLAIWDGAPGGPVGTGADVRLWRASGGETQVIPAGAVQRSFPRPEAACGPPLPRRAAAILFTDFHGFSRIRESHHPDFDREVMGRIAAVLDRCGAAVLARNTWGDALYLVMDGPVAGAETALALQAALAQVDPAGLGLGPGDGGMRIALHFGSVYQSADRVTGLPNFLGNEVARAARIEPVTPPGDVYVTEPFAAMIALHAPDRFHCRYVGRVDLAKKYGTFPMYRLTRAPGVDRGAAGAKVATLRGRQTQ